MNAKIDLRNDERFDELLAEYGISFNGASGSIDPDPLIVYIESRFASPAAPVAEEGQSDDNLGAKLHGTMDAQVWATEFCRLNNAADHGMMLAWFANAIMAGYDHAKREAPPATGEGQQQDERAECAVPPEGWACTRGAGHDGPCAAVPVNEDGYTEKEEAIYLRGVEDGQLVAGGMARIARASLSSPAERQEAEELIDQSIYQVLVDELAGPISRETLRKVAYRIDRLGAPSSPSVEIAAPLMLGRGDDLLSMLQVQAIINTIKPGDGWGGDEWDFALANAVAAQVAKAEREKAAMAGWNDALTEASAICKAVNNHDNPMTAGDCADAIDALRTPQPAANTEQGAK